VLLPSWLVAVPFKLARRLWTKPLSMKTRLTACMGRLCSKRFLKAVSSSYSIKPAASSYYLFAALAWI